MPRKPKVTDSWKRFSALLFAVLLATAAGARADTVVYNSFGPGMTITPMGITGTFTIGPPGTSNFLGAPFSPSSTVDLTSLTANLAAGLDLRLPPELTQTVKTLVAVR